MPNIHTYENEETRHSNDMQDVITAVPSWLVSWGITLFFCILLSIAGMSAIIRYPDIIKAEIKISSTAPSQPVLAKASGRLTKILVKNGENVAAGQPLACMDDTSGQEKVRSLLKSLKLLQEKIIQKRSEAAVFDLPDAAPAAALQSAWQALLNNYLIYKQSGVKHIGEREEEKAKFSQSLNHFINIVESWQNRDILTAPQAGKVSFAGIIQENQLIDLNQEVFYITPLNDHFFGEMIIPQDNMGKIREGQTVLIKLKVYPFEEYGLIRGSISYITEAPYKGSMFMAKVDFTNATVDRKKEMHLKQGMLADAEIITQDATILQRISRSLIKVADNK